MGISHKITENVFSKLEELDSLKEDVLNRIDNYQGRIYDIKSWDNGSTPDLIDHEIDRCEFEIRHLENQLIIIDENRRLLMSLLN